MSVAIALAAMLLHPGGLAADGCHNDRRAGTRHCHRNGNRSIAQPVTAPRGRTDGGAFVNCAAARAAGAAPVYRGSPGYGRHLDRDNDGVGCE